VSQSPIHLNQHFQFKHDLEFEHDGDFVIATAAARAEKPMQARASTIFKRGREIHADKEREEGTRN
jgi:hypothetical protein